MITDSKGHIHWLGKQIRNLSANKTIHVQFQQILKTLQTNKNLKSIFISIHMRAVTSFIAPGSSHPCTVGLNAEEILDIAFLCGTCPQVSFSLHTVGWWDGEGGGREI